MNLYFWVIAFALMETLTLLIFGVFVWGVKNGAELVAKSIVNVVDDDEVIITPPRWRDLED